jgi:hypothetical protein
MALATGNIVKEEFIRIATTSTTRTTWRERKFFRGF